MTRSAFIPNFFSFYNILWQAALPFLKRNKRLGPTIDRRIFPRLSKAHIWIQAASAGESFLALSILRRLCPESATRVLVTTTTDQGADILKQGLETCDFHPNLTCDLDVFPMDMPSAIKRAVAQVNPGVMVLLETEIWPALLHELKAKKIPILILNARMSKKSARGYRLTRKFWQQFTPDRILAISTRDKQRYERVFTGADVSVMNNIKFDILDSQSPGETCNVLTDLFPTRLPLSVIASFRRQEEAQILALLSDLRSRVPDQIIALFPRHMHRIPHLIRKIEKCGIPFVKRSELSGPLNGPAVILWDRFGELRLAYALASAVFVGGSLVPLGGQNFIEPAVIGVPTIIGPHWEDFRWAGEDIFSLGFVSRVQDAESAARAMAENLKTPWNAEKNRRAAATYIQARCGGSRTACRAILEAVAPPFCSPGN